MDEFIGKKVSVECVQEAGWKRPVKLVADENEHGIQRVLSRWEVHTFDDPWWRRKHRVHYAVLLDNGRRYELYWDRGASGEGKDWILLKELQEEEIPGI